MKTKMRKFLVVLLSVCTAFTMMPSAVFAAGDGESGEPAAVSRGADLEGLSVGAGASAATAELSDGVNILTAGAENTVYDIDGGKAVMISGQEAPEGEPIVFKNCTFNLSGKTVKISGNQEGVSYNNGEVVTKLWSGGNVRFENCSFLTDGSDGETGKSTNAGFDACLYFFSGDIQLENCALKAENYQGQFLGFYGWEGSVAFTNCDIATKGNTDGWSYAMYGGSVMKLARSTMTAVGMKTNGEDINVFYSGDDKTGYDAIYLEDSVVNFSDNQAGGFAINNVNIHVDNSEITVNDNLGNACNSGYWIVDGSDVTMNGNRGGHALSCIGFEMTDSDVEILHNGYAGVYIQSKTSSFESCSVDLRCNGERLLSYSAGDLWLNGNTLTVKSCTSGACEGSAWLGGVGRKGSIVTKDCSVTAYDLNSNAADNLKSNTEPVLDSGSLKEEDGYTLFLNPFMDTAYARGNAETTASNNDADLFKDDHVEQENDIIGGDVAKIGTLTASQLSHHRYDWSGGKEQSAATKENYGVLRYACTDCTAYTGHTGQHIHSFDCAGTYVYAPLVGVSFEANAGDDKVEHMPEEMNNLAYGSVPETTTPVRDSGSEEWSWTFTGWYRDADCTEKIDAEGSEGLTKNWTVLYAGWKRTAVPQYEEPVIDKTATALDGNDRTRVTLSIGASEELENVAVLFLLDKSTSQGVRDEAAEMLDELKTKSNTNILYDVVIFSGTATSTGWRDIRDDATLEDTKKNFINGETTGGTNMPSGIYRAMADMETLKEEHPQYATSYLVALSDGITYVWSESDGGEVYCVPVEGIGSNDQVENSPQNGADTWSMMYEYGASLQSVYGGAAQFLSAAPEKMAATREAGSVQEYYGEDKLKNPIKTFIYDDEATEAVAAEYACGPDFAMYYTMRDYARLANMFTHTFAYAVPEADGSGADNTANWKNYPWGREIMEYCRSISTNATWDGDVSNANPEKIFEGIEDQILYAIQRGTVNDVIGDDFTLTDAAGIGLGTFTLTAGATDVAAAAVDGNTVYFGTADGEGVYPYSVTYYPEGKDGDSREQFDWQINVPVGNGSGLKLTYSLDLVHKESSSGSHKVPTNEEAVLQYETSTGGTGELEFPIPEVVYTVSSGGGGGGGGSRPPALNKEDHFAYVIGYPEDYRTGEATGDESLWPVKPQNDITRAEVATIFFRMLTDESRSEYWMQTNPYSDVEGDKWYNNAISTLTNAGILTGYEDGSFRPDAPISRAEFAAMSARFSDAEYSGSNGFSDVSDSHWAAKYIALAQHLGWIDGYPDGTFKPEQEITRAESMKLINEVLDRTPDAEQMLADMITWPDNEKGAWYYADVQEATNSHEYQRSDSESPEKWTSMLEVRDWAELEREWSDANSAKNPGEVVSRAQNNA